jgi:hypothetical protein
LGTEGTLLLSRNESSSGVALRRTVGLPNAVYVRLQVLGGEYEDGRKPSRI